MRRSAVPAQNRNPLVDESDNVERDEQRRHGRIRAKGMIARLGFMRKADVENISATGLALTYSGQSRHKEGDTVRMSLRWRKSALPVQAVVISVRAEAGETSLGLKYDKCSDQEIKDIRALAIKARSWLE